ncbi:MAG: heme ABC transporter ATP-binding protein [Myxococcota bacterium]
MDVKSSLHARAATVNRGGRPILNGANIELVPGEVVGLVGPNGAGKSTLIDVLSAGTAPDAGRVELDGRSLAGYPDVERAQRIAVLPQASSLAFPMQVVDVVLLGRLARSRGPVRDHDRTIAARAMDALDVLHLEARTYPTLSGGEKQRVQIARIMTQLGEDVSGCFVLFDEPIAGLDVAQQFRCLEVARALAEQGASVLVSLHDLNLALVYTDRAVLMNRGHIVADGSPESALAPNNIETVFEVGAYRAELSPGVFHLVLQHSTLSEGDENSPSQEGIHGQV